jgi:hypothetical protein
LLNRHAAPPLDTQALLWWPAMAIDLSDQIGLQKAFSIP